MVVRDVSDLVLKAVAAVSRKDMEDVTGDSTFVDLDVDSLGLVTIVGMLESTMDIELGFEETTRLLKAERVEDVISLVREVVERSAKSV